MIISHSAYVRTRIIFSRLGFFHSCGMLRRLLRWYCGINSQWVLCALYAESFFDIFQNAEIFSGVSADMAEFRFSLSLC